jgi:pyruvate ferredoxin oxidoreductase beta subunit
MPAEKNERKNLFLKGHTACAGCGPAIAMRMITDALGSESVVCLATSCTEIFATRFPTSQFGVPLLHSLFQNTPAVASGVTRGLKQLVKKVVVAAIMGDGCAYDIGFGALSGAMERNEDFIAIVYDNEAYMNTGVQRSGATPFHASTTTSPREIAGKTEWKKNIAFIAAAHGIPYAATASIGFFPDLKRKLELAKTIKGFRLVVVHAPCQLGWGFDKSKTLEVARLAVKTGMWNLYEIKEGAFAFSQKPEMTPVEDYLKIQGRFKHVTPQQAQEIGEHLKRSRAALEKLEASGVNLKEIL